MPFAESNGARLNYRFDGPADAPVLVLSNSLGTNLSMWDPQIPALAERFRVLRYDTRGHGQSSVTPGPYSITQLGRDVVGLLDAVGIERAHFCGLSMGGVTGMWLGVYAPERINRLVLCNTAAKIGAADMWNARIETVRTNGLSAVAETQAQRWFTPAFIAKAPDVIAATRQMIASTSPEGYAANCGAIRDMDQRETISRIRARTLVIGGLQDPVISAADLRYLVDTIPGAKLVELDASHLSNVEAPVEFTKALLNFLTEPEGK
ncbi:MAG: 3-oxoadipate enol-lactonase [Candidatus Acidiferrales bacterium]